MSFLRLLRLPLASLLIYSMAGIAAEEPDPGQVEISVGRLLEQGHYSRKQLDDSVSRKLLTNYLEALDYNHLFFTQKDVDFFIGQFGTKLDDDVQLGRPESAFAIYDVYRKRVEERIAKVKAMLTEKPDFSTDRTVEINRQKSPWPKNEAAGDELWRDRLTGELLQETLAKHKLDTPEKKLTRRYDQMLRNLHEQTREDVMKIFLSTLSQTYDPHSEYLTRSELENFSITMRLSLVGIGAVLVSDEGYAKIMELVPGGPAAKSGNLKVGDRVTAVAQGEKDFVDTVDMKLDKVVEMIRGKKDTNVRMQVIPVNATDPSVRKIVEIRRDEIKLRDQEARAEIIERPQADGTVQRIGWIILPSFYADMDRGMTGQGKSTTRDVLALLNRLKSEGITGLVMDLRRNGGGSLEEAVNLTGLFIKKGPVVQAKDGNGNITVNKDRDPTVAYDGPMVVLTNRLSASASEIFAAALQDYNRAVVVGDHNTFGKGTVQTMLEIGRIMPFLGGGNEAGALKLTIQKFYRVAGGSTQHKGVVSDIILPSLFDQADIGESALKGPLPYDTVDPVPYERLEKSLSIPELNKRSAARITADPEFRYIAEDMERVKKRVAENTLSLNEALRRKEIEDDKARKDLRTAERAKRKLAEPKVFGITLENVNAPELQLAKVEPKPETAEAAEDSESEEMDKTPAVDPVRNETLNIVGDLIELSRTPRTASSK